MNKLVQRLIKDSLIKRNWIVLSNYSTTSHVNFSPDSLASRRFDDSFEKGRETLLTSEREITNFIKRMEKNYMYMGREEVIRALDTVHKSVHSQSIKLDLTNIQGFEHMCNVIQKEARFLNMYDTVRLLRILTFFKIPSQTSLVTTLLQLLSTSMSKLTIGQLMVVHGILQNMSNAPNINYLKRTAVKIFTEKVETGINSETPNLLKLLKFCVIIRNESSIRQIISILVRDKNKMNADYIVDIYHAICVLPKLSPADTRLLFILNNMILNNAKLLKIQDVVDLLTYMVNKIENSQTEFYNEDAINVLQRALLTNESATFLQKLTVLRMFNKIQYSCPKMIDQLAKESLQDRDIFKKFRRSNETEFINACVIADHKPNDWEKFEELLKNYIAVQDYSIYSATSTAFRLLSLDSYQPELLEKVFKLCNDLSSLPKPSLLNISRLYWCVKVLYPDYKGVMLDDNKVNELNQFLLEMNDTCNLPSLRESLEKVAGGAEYVKHGLRTKFGEFVDVVIVQSDGSLMNISSCENIAFAEELTSFPDCIKILFFTLPKSAFSINEKNVISTVKMLLKTVEILPGFSAFVINPYRWKTFTSNGKISHLEEVIKSKRNSISTN